MGRLFVILLLCSSLSIGLYIFLQQATRGSTRANSASAPKRTLDNVHQKAKSIEEDAQKRMDETLRKTE